jgi:hypothetical protein
LQRSGKPEIDQLSYSRVPKICWALEPPEVLETNLWLASNPNYSDLIPLGWDLDKRAFKKLSQVIQICGKVWKHYASNEANGRGQSPDISWALQSYRTGSPSIPRSQRLQLNRSIVHSHILQNCLLRTEKDD